MEVFSSVVALSSAWGAIWPARGSQGPGAAIGEAGVVETVGRGRGTKYILSRSLYAAIGSKGAYTRRKGLDRETNKALLLRHVEDNAGSGARMEELMQVLPALPRSQIQVLLRELRADGKVHMVGATRAARWYPGAAPPIAT